MSNTNIKVSVNVQMANMQATVIGNLVQCCQECLEWHNTGILPDGKVREAASYLTDAVFSGNQLVHVENFVKQSAMECLVGISTPSKK